MPRPWVCVRRSWRFSFFGFLLKIVFRVGERGAENSSGEDSRTEKKSVHTSNFLARVSEPPINWVGTGASGPGPLKQKASTV